MSRASFENNAIERECEREGLGREGRGGICKVFENAPDTRECCYRATRDNGLSLEIPELILRPVSFTSHPSEFWRHFLFLFFLKRVGEGSAPDLATAAFKKRLERDWSVRASRDVIVHVERFALEACGNGVRGRHAKLKGLQALGGLGESTSR